MFNYFAKYFVKNVRVFNRTFLTSSLPDIKIPRITTAEFFFSYADKYHDKVAFIDDVRNIKYTYMDTKKCINGIASAFTKKGVKFGTMVGIVASNCPEYVMLFLALSSMGCTVTVCNNNYTTTEMVSQLMDSKPSILFTDNVNVQNVAKVAVQVPSVQNIYLIGDRMPSFSSVYDLMEDDGSLSPIGQIDIDIDNHIAVMPYSSGTTGIPKGVMLTHHNLVSNMLQINSTIPVDEYSTMVMSLPLYHIYALTVINTNAFTSGSKIIFKPKMNLNQYIKIIDQYKANLLHLVPPHILFFLNDPDIQKYDISHVKKCLCGAAPLDPVTEMRFLTKLSTNQPDFRIIQGYGMSETSPLTHISPTPLKHSMKEGSIGKLVPNMKCKVVNVLTREEVGPNEDGELLLKGPNVMKGYFNKSEATKNAFEEGWFQTGDVAFYDEDQFFYIKDRLKELIKVKGYQVAPAEIEGLLLSHPSVADCAVIGVKHEQFGEVPKAFIVKAKEINDVEIHDYIAEHLSTYKHLKGGIIFTDQIPKSPSGKILRRLLKN